MSRRAIHRRRAVAPMLCLAVSLAGCGDGERARSQTPRVKQGASSDLTRRLLTTADVRAVRGLARDFEAVSLDAVRLYENPDPRGPCGARIDPPALSRGQGVGLRSEQDFGWEFVFALPLAEAKAYVGSVVADTRAGCPAYRSRTNTGSTQQVRLERVVAIGAVGDERTASAFTITNDGRTLRGAQLTIRDANRVAQLVLFTPLSDDALRALATRAAARLVRAR